MSRPDSHVERTGVSVVDDSAFKNSEVELFSVGGHDGILREVNHAFAALLGRPVDEVNGRSVLEFIHPDDLTEMVAGIAALELGGSEVLMENRFLQSTGSAVYLQWVARPVAGTQMWWAAGRDTTEFHQLLARHEDLRVVMDLALGEGLAAMWDLDIRTGTLSWERNAAELLGVTFAKLPATAVELADLVHPADSAPLLEAFTILSTSGAAQVLVAVGQAPQSRRHLSLRGRVLTRDRRDRPVRAVGLVLDVTAEKAMEEQLLRLVMSDALTGVPNRRAFDQTLRTEWRRCARAGKPLSVLMIDIDNFKGFNDAFGHPVGDAALIAVARTLAGGLRRAGDTLARYGGEEFAVILPDVDTDGAAVVALRLVEAVRYVVVRQAAGWQFTVSIGAAACLAGQDLAGYADLLARADTALYTAKAEGRDRVHLYSTPARHLT